MLPLLVRLTVWCICRFGARMVASLLICSPWESRPIRKTGSRRLRSDAYEQVGGHLGGTLRITYEVACLRIDRGRQNSPSRCPSGARGWFAFTSTRFIDHSPKASYTSRKSSFCFTLYSRSFRWLAHAFAWSVVRATPEALSVPPDTHTAVTKVAATGLPLCSACAAF